MLVLRAAWRSQAVVPEPLTRSNRALSRFRYSTEAKRREAVASPGRSQAPGAIATENPPLERATLPVTVAASTERGAQLRNAGRLGICSILCPSLKRPASDRL